MSQAEIIELHPLEYEHGNSKKGPGPSVTRFVSNSSANLSTPQVPRTVLDGTIHEDGTESPQRPSVAASVEIQQKWNEPRINMYRTFSTFWCMLVMGMNDAAYGALIPYLESYYDLNYTTISLTFLVPVAGYLCASLNNSAIHVRFGQRGVAIMGPISKLIAYIVIAAHPPYPALVAVFVFAGFANGLEDSGWNAWVGAMANANEVLGFLHGCYGLGGVLSPLIATTMITKGHLPWYSFYYIMIGAAVIELVVCSSAFWASSGAVFRETHPVTTNRTDNRMKEALFTMPSARITWQLAIFLLGYVGTEVSLGGWIVTFMIRVRHGGPFASGMTATGFWLGITVGRVILGFVTGRLGEKLAIAIYLALAMLFELLFWLVPQFYVSAVAIALQGFFLGPLFPAAVVVATKLLPKHLHIAGIGFAASFGGCGAALMPFAVGAIAQAKGVKVLQPIVLSLLALIWGIWVALPRLPKVGKRE